MTVKKNVKWVALSQASKVILQLLSLTILTRLITPDQYGIMAMAMVVTNFALIFRDLGTSSAIIQRKKLTPEIVSSVFWLNMFMGTGICLLLIIISPYISSLFKQGLLDVILIILSLSFPISSLGAVHQALLERESKFKLIAAIEISSSTLGLVIAVASAYIGAGVYSLVFQTLTSCVISTSAYWLFNDFRPKFAISKNDLKSLISFSGNLTLFNLINYFSRNVDSIIIGRKFSAIVLGSYSLSYRIMLFPIQSLSIVAARSLYPVMSKNQDDLGEIKNLFFKTLTVIASVTAPMMFGLVVIRESFVNVVFGNQWEIVPSLILWMAPIGFIQSLLSVTGSVMVAQGKTALQMYLGLLSSVLSVSAFIIGAWFSIYMLAKLYLLANVISGLISLYVCTRSIKASFYELITNISAPLISAMCMAGIVFYIQNAVSVKYYLGDYTSVVLYVSIGFIVYVLVYRFLFSQTFEKVAPKILKKILL